MKMKWLLLILAVVSFVVFIFAYRNNNLVMVELREEVFLADREGGDVEEPLRRLREHVHSHMNTDLAPTDSAVRPPIQLKYRYEALVEEEMKRVSDRNEEIYTNAQVFCEQRFPGSLTQSGRIPCIEEYVDRNGVEFEPIPESLYKFDFVSPRWSPDLAGFSLVVSVVSFAGFLMLSIVGLLRRFKLFRRS
jgi:hypothetical protein